MAIASLPRSPRYRRVAFWVIVTHCATQMFCADAADSDWPEAWFEAPKTASQLGITAFKQSPVLAGQNLPPVENRLPEDPVVSVPLSSNGSYGGTAHIIVDDANMFYGPEGPFTISADHKTILPNLAESWWYSEDGLQLTVTLRKGLKWSDGHPLSSDDFLFMMNDVQLNLDYQPVTPRTLAGMKLHAVDPWTLVYTFNKPSPFFINFMAQSPESFLAPKHYFSQFHPSYTDADQIDERLREIGFINWSTFVQTSLQMRRFEELINQPTMRAFTHTTISPILVRYERNPYYFKIDPTGKQLPYVDAIEAEIVSGGAVPVAKASTGQLDFAAFRLPTQDIPLLKLGEQNSGIKVKIWRRLHGSDLVIQTNFNHTNVKLRTLFWDVRFRRALSLAIDRDEMNEIIYFGRGVPRQVTVIPDSDYFEPHFATAYTEFDTSTSNQLLDELGLDDIDGDGLREYPDGSKLTITVEYVDTETPKQISMELVSSYWNSVGIDVRLKLIDRGLQYSRAISGAMEMTVWHADRTTDILFPINPDFWVPRKLAASLSMWSEWSRWYLTDGRLGEEPPQEIRNLQEWADQLATSMDPSLRIQLGKKILASNAENVWSIGTIGLAPHPVVVSNRLKNVVEQGLWGYDTRWTLPYHPATWYLDQ